MAFRVQEDDGRLRFQVMGAGTEAGAQFVVVRGDGSRRTVVGVPSEAEPAQAGRHSEPSLDVLIDTSMELPGPAARLELYDATSNLLVFRRPEDEPCGLRHFHLETQSFPFYEPVRAFAGRLQLGYTGAELIDEAALGAVLDIDYAASLLVCGALAYRRYAAYLRREGFTRSILLCDPHRELAGRLLVAQRLGCFGGASGGWKSLGRAGLVAAVDDRDLTDTNAVAALLRELDDAALRSLSNPLVHLLAANGPDDVLASHHVEDALDGLSEFEVVGFADDLRGFADALEALADSAGGRSVSLAADPATEPRDLAAITQAVAECPEARSLVELDETVLGLVREAVATA